MKTTKLSFSLLACGAFSAATAIVNSGCCTACSEKVSYCDCAPECTCADCKCGTDAAGRWALKLPYDSMNTGWLKVERNGTGSVLWRWASPMDCETKIEGDKLVISSSSSDEITMSGSAAMNALKMNYTYKGIYQLGIATTSTDYGKSGELEFDTEKFMEALEDNPDEVESLMLKFASTMDSWTKSMLNSSASGQTSGTLTRQIEDIDTQIASIDEYLEKYQDRLDRMEESLRSKYAAAEQSISKLTQQASAMASILQQMTGSNSNSSSSS